MRLRRLLQSRTNHNATKLKNIGKPLNRALFAIFQMVTSLPTRELSVSRSCWSKLSLRPLEGREKGRDANPLLGVSAYLSRKTKKFVNES